MWGLQENRMKMGTQLDFLLEAALEEAHASSTLGSLSVL
jgi:hypothetical protein